MVAVVAGVAAGALAAKRALDGPLRLLRADLMPVVVAILGKRFEPQRTIAYGVLVEQVADDLDTLRDAGFTLPRSAQEYVADWVRDGHLVRRASSTAREETVELSRAAADVVRFVAAVEQPRSSVTSSRLSNVAGLLDALAGESDPDAANRIDALMRQRGDIDAEIAQIQAGDFQPLDGYLAKERLSEVLRLAAEIPGDFAKVSDDLESLNGQLREQIINNDGARGGVLDEVFAGVDLIEHSEAGASFSAFHDLLLDRVLVDRFDTAVEAVLERPFTADLGGSQTTFLRRFLSLLQRESNQVRRALTDFSRSLRRFVETQEYREHKRLADTITRAEQAALEALKTRPPTTELGRGLDLSSVRIASISAWLLRNPADMRSNSDVTAHETTELDLAQLRELVRITEIDFAELEGSIAETVSVVAGATVADVLDRHPASQGLASIVGLLLLAEQHASRASGIECWRWCSIQGQSRSVRVPRYVFTHVPEHWSKHEPALRAASR